MFKFKTILFIKRIYSKLNYLFTSFSLESDSYIMRYLATVRAPVSRAVKRPLFGMD